MLTSFGFDVIDPLPSGRFIAVMATVRTKAPTRHVEMSSNVPMDVMTPRWSAPTVGRMT